MSSKLVLATLGALAFVAASTDARASEPDCRISVSNDDIAYGALNRERQSKEPEMVMLGKRQFSVMINCDSPAPMAFRLDGEQALSGSFGFDRLGRLNLSVKDAFLDGQPVALRATGNQVGRATPRFGLAVRPGQTIIAMQEGQRAKGLSFRATVEIEASIQDSAFSTRDVTQLETQLSFTYIPGE